MKTPKYIRVSGSVYCLVPERIKHAGHHYRLVVTAQDEMVLSYEQAAKMFGVTPYDELLELNADFVGEAGSTAYQEALEEGLSEEEAEEMQMKGQEAAESEVYDTWSSDIWGQANNAALAVSFNMDETESGLEFSTTDWDYTALRIYQTLMGTGLVGWTSYDEFLEAEGDGTAESAVRANWKGALSTAKEVWG